MTVGLWPCHACGADGIRNLGVDGYCSTHLAALYATFDPAVFIDGGIGLPDGLQRPDYVPTPSQLKPANAVQWMSRAASRNAPGSGPSCMRGST